MAPMTLTKIHPWPRRSSVRSRGEHGQPFRLHRTRRVDRAGALRGGRHLGADGDRTPGRGHRPAFPRTSRALVRVGRHRAPERDVGPFLPAHAGEAASPLPAGQLSDRPRDHDDRQPPAAPGRLRLQRRDRRPLAGDVLRDQSSAGYAAWDLAPVHGRRGHDRRGRVLVPRAGDLPARVADDPRRASSWSRSRAIAACRTGASSRRARPA